MIEFLTNAAVFMWDALTVTFAMLTADLELTAMGSSVIGAIALTPRTAE